MKMLDKIILNNAIRIYKKEIIPGLKGNVLDYGCGKGYLLRTLKVKGIKADGLDVPSRYYNKKELEQEGFKIYEVLDRNYDTIILTRVIEVVVDHQRIIDNVKEHAIERIIGIFVDKYDTPLEKLFLPEFICTYKRCINGKLIHFMFKKRLAHYKDIYVAIYERAKGLQN